MFTTGIVINLVRTLAYLIAIVCVTQFVFIKSNKPYIISFLYLIYKWLVEIYSRDTLWEKIIVTVVLLILYCGAIFIADNSLDSPNHQKTTNGKQTTTTPQEQINPDDEQWQKADQAQFEAFLAKQAPLDSKNNDSLER